MDQIVVLTMNVSNNYNGLLQSDNIWFTSYYNHLHAIEIVNIYLVT